MVKYKAGGGRSEAWRHQLGSRTTRVAPDQLAAVPVAKGLQALRRTRGLTDIVPGSGQEWFPSRL